MTQRATTIFVSNLSFDCTEDDIRGLFGQVGQIAAVRMPHDSSTGKPRGFGFVEYMDAEAALSAVRNLAEAELNGRPLRVSVAEKGADSGGDSKKRRLGSGGGGGGVGCGGAGASAAAAAAVAARARIQESTAQQVTAVVEGTGSAQLFAMLQETQAFAAEHPAQARALFAQQPQLYHAVRLSLDRVCGPHGNV